MPSKQHIMHGRDHEHGGADPLYYTWEGGAMAIPFCYWQQLSVDTSFASGTHAPNIETFKRNSAGASVFSVSGTHAYAITIAESGIYGVSAVFGVTNDVTLNANGGVFLGLFLPGAEQIIDGAKVRGDVTANQLFREVYFNGIFQWTGAGETYLYFSNGQTLSQASLMGGTMWQITTDLWA